MRKVLAALAVSALGLFAAPAVSGAVTDLLFQQAFDELVAWDPAMAALAPASPPGPGQDFAVGSHKVTDVSGDFQHVRVSAHSGPSGEDPKGSVRVTFDSFLFGGAGDLKGDVVCLDVSGPQARVAALLREPYMNNTHVTLVLSDNGNPGPFMGQSPDSAFIDFTSSPLPPTCSIAALSVIGNASGNILVRDAL